MLLSIIYSIPGFAALAWALWLVLFSHKKHETQKAMVVLLLALFASSVLYSQYFNEYITHKFLLDLLFTSVSLFCPSYYVIFIKSFTVPIRSSFSNAHYLCIPILYAIVFFSLGVISSIEDQELYTSVALQGATIPDHPTVMVSLLYGVGHYFYCYYLVVSVFVCTLYGVLKTATYHKKLDEYYSNDDQLGMRTMWHVVGASSLTFALTTIFVLLPFSERSSITSAVIVASVGVIVVSAIAYYTKRLNYTAVQLSVLMDSTQSVPEEPALSGHLVEIKRKLESAMDIDMAYLDSNLTIVTLAAKLNTNRTYLSKVINSMFGCSFSNYVNNYRVEYAKELMVSNSDKLLQNVALESGFNSLNSFSSHFYRVTGSSPSEWRKSRLNL